jgi:hypothetical protein
MVEQHDDLHRHVEQYDDQQRKQAAGCALSDPELTSVFETCFFVILSCLSYQKRSIQQSHTNLGFLFVSVLQT